MMYIVHECKIVFISGGCILILQPFYRVVKALTDVHCASYKEYFGKCFSTQIKLQKIAFNFSYYCN